MNITNDTTANPAMNVAKEPTMNITKDLTMQLPPDPVMALGYKLGSTLEPGTGRSGASIGCSNIFSVFAFLAFLFALLDFIMGMNGRRRREAVHPSCSPVWHHTEEGEGREATLAIAYLWRGRLLSSSTDTCSSSTRCWAARSAAALGR